MFNNGYLALAFLNGRLHSVKFLVDVVNLPVNDKHGYEQTALHKATLMGHTDVCDLLLQSEAEIDSQDQELEAALHVA